jgi:hypothetical protein
MAEPELSWPVPKSPLLDQTIAGFVTNGLIYANLKTTERGAMHIDTLCTTPWPVQKWVVPDRASV